MTRPQSAPRRRHKPMLHYGYPDYQTCLVCGAIRDMWGGKPSTPWTLKYGPLLPWCPGKKVASGSHD